VEETYLNVRAINRSIHTSSGIVIDDWATDAYLLHLSRPSSSGAAVERYFMSDGSYLRRKGRSVIESLSKLTACWSLGDSVEVFSDDASAYTQIAAERPPQSARGNDKSVSTAYDKQKKLVLLKLSRPRQPKAIYEAI
jgi:hypothetical protein